MGVCNISFIPAAILYSNPGINKEEFVTLLDEIRFFDGLTNAVFDFGHPLHQELGSPDFHGGIFELAKILNLKHNLDENFLVTYYALDYLNDKPERNSLGRLIIKPTEGKNRWISPRYYIQKGIKEKNISGGVNKTKWFFDEPSLGQIYCSIHDYFRIRKVHNVKHEIDNGHDKFIANVDFETFKYLPVYEKFDSLEKLISKYPKYDPSIRIRWDQSEGIFITPNFISYETIKWERINKGYYLKKDALEDSDYTSIIITAEAIRKKEWAMFQFHGYCLTNKFLIENEDSDYAHQKAVIDFWTSQYAKSKTMSNFDLLGYRIQNGLANIKYQRFSDREAFHLIYQDAIIDHGIISNSPKAPTLDEVIFGNPKDTKDDVPF